MRQKLMKFMMGRYGLYSRGLDSLNKFLAITVISLGLTTIVLSFIPLYPVLVVIYVIRIIEYLLLFYAIFRFLSKNIARRQAENMAYFRLRTKIVNFFKGKREHTDRTHKIFKCPDCKARVRVPRGKGKIRITCPKCGRKFLKRT